MKIPLTKVHLIYNYFWKGGGGLFEVRLSYTWGGPLGVSIYLLLCILFYVVKLFYSSICQFVRLKIKVKIPPIYDYFWKGKRGFFEVRLSYTLGGPLGVSIYLLFCIFSSEAIL